MPDRDPNRIHQVVERAWRTVLDAGSARGNDPFDTVGGDSLGFMRLIHLIEEELDTAIPLDRVSPGLAPAELATTIHTYLAHAAVEPSDDIAHRPVVFMIPVAGGDGPGQARLRAGCADRLDIQRVDLPDWRGTMRPGFTFEALCARMAQEIIAKAGPGPIYLAGYCFGGAVASIVARMLRAQGYAVGHLGLLDADISWFRRPTSVGIDSLSGLAQLKSLRWAWQQGRLPEHLAWLAAELLERRGRGVLRWLARGDRTRHLPERFRYHLNLYLQMTLLPRIDRPAMIRMMTTDQLAFVPTTVFRTGDHDVERPDDLGWSELFAPVEVVTIAGDHQGVFEPASIDALCDAFTDAVTRSIAAYAAVTQDVGRNPVATT